MSNKRFFFSLYLAVTLIVKIFGAVLSPGPALAIPLPDEYAVVKKEMHGKRYLYQKYISTEAQMIDVKKYTLAISFYPYTYSITGHVTIEADIQDEPLNRLMIDMHDTLIIDNLTFNGTDKGYTHAGDRIEMLFSPPLQSNDSFEITIAYHGEFAPEQGSGLIFSVHGEDEIPVIATLSEPYLAPSWWPCIDNPDDKALAELYFTAPTEMKGEKMRVLSNGVPADTASNADGTTTFHWSVKNPIATYLVCVAISNYIDMDSLNSSYISTDGSKNMPLNFYCYPEHEEAAEYVFAQVKDELTLFAELFGEYPFIDEKHAIIEIPMESSGMEHQTIVCMQDEMVGIADPVSRVTVGHEVAHQWWGDAVTMRTWHDIWLNEGLATFFQMYYREAFGEIDAVIDKLKIFGTALFAESYQKSVYVQDVSDPFADQGAIYFKGAWVIHMLREMLADDDIFFAVLRSYYLKHAYGTAATADLKTEFEEGWGTSLEAFFDQWIYSPAWPIYNYEITDITKASNGRYRFDLLLFQSQTHSIIDIAGNEKRDYYIMPIDLTLQFGDGTARTFTLLNHHRQQRFQLETDLPPSGIAFDQDIKILKEVDLSAPIPDDNSLPSAWGYALALGRKAPLKVFLLGGGNDDDGTIIDHTWVVDNKHFFNGRFNVITLEEIGKHRIFLTVTDDQAGAGSSVPVYIEVLQ